MVLKNKNEVKKLLRDMSDAYCQLDVSILHSLVLERIFGIDKEKSQQITDAIDAGDYSKKPGWVRISLHPTTSNEELDYILEAIGKVARNGRKWSADYSYDSSKENGWNFKGEKRALPPRDPLFRR